MNSKTNLVKRLQLRIFKISIQESYKMITKLKVNILLYYIIFYYIYTSVGSTKAQACKVTLLQVLPQHIHYQNHQYQFSQHPPSCRQRFRGFYQQDLDYTIIFLHMYQFRQK